MNYYFLQVEGSYWATFISWKDFVLLPLYLLIVFSLFFKYLNKHYDENHPWHKYFKYGFIAKIIGAISIGLVYQYYYRGGDTSVYFFHGNVINSALFKNPAIFFDLLFHTRDNTDPVIESYVQNMLWYDAPSEYIVCCITAVISILGLGTYLTTSVIFATLAFPGCWMLFKLFAEKYPPIAKYIAASVLFLPSLVMWGSGIFKDTICLSCLGWLTYSSVKIFIERKLKIGYFIALIISTYLISVIKVYILLAFLPSLFIWILFQYTSNLKSSVIRFFINLLLVAFSGLAFLAVANKFSEELGQYSLENITETSAVTRDYLNSFAEAGRGTSYSLGEVDPTPVGMLKKFPAAVNVTLFRPYLWEARKLMVFLNAIEVTLFLLLTLKVLISVGPLRSFKTLRTDPTVLFFFTFTIIFAFAVGITSINFGALSRYRVPCLPFFMLMLIFIYYKNKPISNDLLKFSLK